MPLRTIAFIAVSFFLGGESLTASPFLFTPLGDLPGGPFNSVPTSLSADGSVVVGNSNSAKGPQAFRWTAAGGMVGLGDLPGGLFLSNGKAVSADGSTVVGTSNVIGNNPTDGLQAFRYKAADGMVAIALPGAPPGEFFYSSGNGVSADGSVVVGASNSTSDYQAFRWTAGGGIVGLGDLPGGVQSEAKAVSADGSVVVGQGGSTAGLQAFRWTAGGGMVGLGDLPGGAFGSNSIAASADGSVIVGESESASGHQAYRWTAGGGMVGLGDLPGGGFYSVATGVSADGSAVVGISDPGTIGMSGGLQAFRWTASDGMVRLGSLSDGSYANDSVPKGVSGNGVVVVGRSASPSVTEAFVWAPSGGIANLGDHLVNQGVSNLTGWLLVEASAISPDGRTIIGYGFNPNNQTEAWIATDSMVDVNGDWFINIFDVNLISANWGASATVGEPWVAGDANGDGIVDIFDINAISANWTDSGGGTGGATAVPEPCAIALALVAAGGCLLRISRLRHAAAVTATFALAISIARPSPLAAANVTMAWSRVGNAGNAADTAVMQDDTIGYGAVPYVYDIGTTEVTNAQYAAFLNEKAKSDPLALYSANMDSDPYGGITRSGLSPNFSYAVKTNMGNKPVNYVSWYDAIRFVNWLKNGQGSGDTETGTYTLEGGTPEPSNVLGIVRNVGATVFLPSENEWYKAAYHQPAVQGGDVDNFWEYPTGTNNVPTIATANSVGDISNPGPNVANYIAGADWNGQDGNVTSVGSAGELSKSFYGTSDQGGNVYEWNEALIRQINRGIRGGTWSFDDSIDLRSSWRSDSFPQTENNQNGFRVASVPEPSTAVLCGLGVLTALGFSQHQRKRMSGKPRPASLRQPA